MQKKLRVYSWHGNEVCRYQLHDVKTFPDFFNPLAEFVLLSSGLGLKKQKMKGGAFGSPPFRGQ
jgi:hypothetical protein